MNRYRAFSGRPSSQAVTVFGGIALGPLGKVSTRTLLAVAFALAGVGVTIIAVVGTLLLIIVGVVIPAPAPGCCCAPAPGRPPWSSSVSSPSRWSRSAGQSCAVPDPGSLGLAEQVQWLVDRASISDLLVEFARSLDEKDWDTHVALYLPDGVFVAGDVFRLEGHEELIRTSSPRALGQYAATSHGSSNHAITIDGDTATTRSYLIGVHVLGDDPAGHADSGGWYDCTLRRTADGWRFATVRINEVWSAGAALPHMGPPPS